ncbi:MAG: hypothetical protein GY762_05660 [Proteobacteria bacterium]|nr:hypothetical protein [Pseudomonadota bacterium]
MTKRRVTLILSFALLLALVAIPAAAQSYPDPGTGSTYTELANTTTDSASISITYYDQDGATTAGPDRTIPGNGSTAIDPASSQLPQGYNGAGVVSSNKPLASTVNTRWTGGPGDHFEMALYSGVSAGSERICFPFLAKFSGGVTSMTIQNTGTASADISVTYYKRDGTNEGKYDDSIPQGAQHTYDLRTSSATVPNLTAPWDGSAVVTVNNGQTVAGVAVYNQNMRSNTYNASDCAGLSGSTVLVSPSQFRGYTGQDDPLPDVSPFFMWSAVVVQNLEDSAATVTLQYTPRNPALPSKTISNASIPAFSAQGWNLRSTEFSGLGGSLPKSEAWDGSVVITSDKAIAAVSNTQWNRAGSNESGYSTAVNAADNDTKFWVPGVVRIKSGSTIDDYSALNIQNISAGSASVTTKFYGRGGNLIHTQVDSLNAGQAIGYNTRSDTDWDPSVLGDSYEGHAEVDGGGVSLAVVLNKLTKNPGGSAVTNGVTQ